MKSYHGLDYFIPLNIPPHYGHVGDYDDVGGLRGNLWPSRKVSSYLSGRIAGRTSDGTTLVTISR